MQTDFTTTKLNWRGGNNSLVPVIAAGAFLLALVLFWSGLAQMVNSWSREEYSHGYLIPFIALFLFAKRLPRISGHAPDWRWVGGVLSILAVLLGLAGNISQISDISQYGFMVFLVGLSVSTLGLRNTLRLWVPFVYLAFMIPLPQVVYLKLSGGMQLISSELGVAFIRLAGISVFLEGNVIDLGVYKLQVVEACSGLRYLFPLMSFGFLFTALYRGPVWIRVLLFLSTIPITILMNSFRIGVIGVLVNSFGISQAEGFLHFFEGWIIFVACTAILFSLAYLLTRIGPGSGRLSDAMDLSPPIRQEVEAALKKPWSVRFPAFVLVAMLAGATLVQWGLTSTTSLPPRLPLATFPSLLEGWQGKQEILPSEILRVLGADDYVMANYASAREAGPVNIFISYYDSQTDGRAVHSPEVCIPGDGWEIKSFEPVALVLPHGGDKMTVNRAVIEKGGRQQLVYYWFEGRQRSLTSEYAVKWYILWDGLWINRTDGSLVRFTTPVLSHETMSDAEQRLLGFLGQVKPLLPRYIPS